MFGINPGEFAVLLLVAIIVVGPERLPKYAQQLGRLVREGRKMAMGLREQVRGELGPEFDDVDWTKLDPRQYDPRRIIREALTDTLDDEPAKPAKPADKAVDKAVSSGGPTAVAATAAAAATGAAAAAPTTSLAKSPASGAPAASPAAERPSSAASPMAAAAVGKPAPGPTGAVPAGATAAAPGAEQPEGATDASTPAPDQPAVPQARSAAGAAVDLEAT